MRDRVDELFEGDPLPGVRLGLLRAAFYLSCLLILLGLLSCSAVPGALLAIWVWWFSGEELAAISQGTRRSEDGEPTYRLHQHARRLLSAAGLVLLVQLYLLTATQYYEQILSRFGS